MQVSRWALMTGLGLVMVAAPVALALSNIALRFVATQRDAPVAVLVDAKRDASDRLTLRVVRVLFGAAGSTDWVPQHPDWFNGQLRDGRQYLVLLEGGEAYRGHVTPDGLPIIGCGVVNTLEVVDGFIADPTQYDVTFIGTSKRLTLATVERDLIQAHKGRQVSNRGLQPTDGAPSCRTSRTIQAVGALGG